MMTIGQRIRQLREESDLSLRELAKKIGVSAPFLSDVELGRRNPSDKHLSSLARALDTTLKDLGEYDTRPPMRDLRRMAMSNPEYGFALRQMIDKKISPQELIEFIEELSRQQKEDKDKK